MKIVYLRDKGVQGTITIDKDKIRFSLLGKTITEQKPAFLKDIIKINEFDVTTGYIAYEANTGEEYIDLWDLFEQHGINYKELLEGEGSVNE